MPEAATGARAAAAPAKLPMGMAATVLTANAAAPLLHTDDALLGETLDESAIESIPMDGRNLVDLKQKQALAAAAAAPANFPGRLPIAATGTVANHILALDASGALFVSDDGGRQWRAVPSPWQGRVARLQVTAFPLASAGGGRAPAAGGAAAAAAAPKALAAAPNQNVIADSGIAPTSNASVSGVIADPTGAVIPGATVTATDTRTKQAYKVTSDTSGRYTLSGLAADTYQLTVQSPGFASQQQSLLLAAGAQAMVNAMLTVSAASQQVTVSAELAPLLNTEDAVIGETLTATPATAAQPVQRRQAPAVFEITTEAGDLWTSTDGQRWIKR